MPPPHIPVGWALKIWLPKGGYPGSGASTPVVATHSGPAVSAPGRNTADTAPRRGEQHFSAFCTLIEAQYNTHPQVHYYARRLGITAAHLNALCRKTVGKSALTLIHERVLLEAKRNLVYTSMTISQVSDAAGFKDPAYFSRFFARMTGMSPRAFRQCAGTSET